MSSPVKSPDITVLIADDQRVVREGLAGLIDLIDGLRVVAAVGDGQDAIEKVVALGPDVVLMDLRMPRVDGIEATRKIIEERPESRVIVLTTYSDDESIAAALLAGAHGYLTKDATAESIATAIRAVYAGAFLLDPTISGRVVERFARDRPQAVAATDQATGLTVRERQVLELIAGGKSNDEIAESLCVGMATVKTHVNNLFSKLAVRDRAQAVAYAYQHGYVDQPPPPG